nr:hypothetical protein [Tanacetum cinerariifolium]
MSWFSRCSWCGGPFNGGNCQHCTNKKVYVVNGVLASSVDMVLEKEFAGFALQVMEIYPLMLLIRTLSMNLQMFSPTPQNPSTSQTRYFSNHQEDLNHQRMNDVDDRWNKMIESGNKIIQLLGETVLQQKQAANIDQSSPQEMSIQDMEDLKQQYLDEMKSFLCSGHEQEWNGRYSLILGFVMLCKKKMMCLVREQDGRTVVMHVIFD